MKKKNLNKKNLEEVSSGLSVATSSPTKPKLKIVISKESHPFYTGKPKTVDASGRVDRFKKRFGKS